MSMLFDCPKCGTVWRLDKKLEAAVKFSRENHGVLVFTGERTCGECGHTFAANKMMELAYEKND